MAQRCFLFLLGICVIACDEQQSTHAPSLEVEAPLGVRQLLLENSSGVLELPFAQVIEQTSGTRILPIDQNDPVTGLLLNAVGVAIEATIVEMNAPDSPVKSLRRINEASRWFEDALLERLNLTEPFSAQIPKTAAGTAQRSGYPDIRIVHPSSGRIFYLDPKLYEATSERSSLRSFYFTPKQETNKVLDDASHLLLGIAHDGNDGDWQFTGWKLVDLSQLTVRLKPEFQASNRDLYIPKATIRSGTISN